jgi:hypothetical protein
VAKSIKHRLKTDETPFDNLYLTGDWIKNGFDLGCVESAVMSGMLTSRAICGYPKHIVGETDDWLKDVGLGKAPLGPGSPGEAGGESPPGAVARYVEYGGLTTVPSPVECEGARLYGFILEGDLDKIKALCHKVFYQPSGGQVDYQPVSRYVMLTFGDIPQIIPKVDPFNRMGTTSEKQVALWVLTAAVRREGSVLVAERLAWFVPYMFVHNPISLSGGREIYGYAKNWGWLGMPSDEQDPGRFTLDAFGMREYSTHSKAKRVPLLQVRRVGPSQTDQGRDKWESLDQAFGEIRKQISGDQDMFMLPGLELAESLFHDLTHEEVPQVFLKQFRSVANGLNASTQAVVEAPSKLTRFEGMSFLDKYSFTLHHLDSHPIGNDLGLKSQDALLSFWVEMDFILEDGSVIWQPSSREAKGCLPRLGRFLGRR